MTEPSLSIELCGADESHARQVMTWRNDPTTLAMSFHHEPKSWERFWPEYRDEYLSEPGLPPLFLLDGGTRVGFLRFRPIAHPQGLAGRVVDISLMIAPDRRGTGLGKAALRAGLDFLRRAGVDSAVAEIRTENAASVACFAAAGFVPLDEVDKRIPDTGETCRIARSLYELTSAFWRRDRVFVIAEAGSNWRMGTAKRDLAMGKALIEVAAEAGADAVKFQTYRPETVYVADAGKSDYLAESGIEEDIGEIFADLAMPYELIPELAAHARAQGLHFMSTPFSPADFAAVDPHVAVHKIASYEISHVHLLELAAKSGKPLVLSTGASNAADIAWAVETFRAAGGKDLALMQCTAKYPAPPESLNLQTIRWLKARFGVAPGLSDHSRDPLHAPLAAVALGARVIEKHYSLDNRLPGPDHAFAVTPTELKTMVSGIRAVEQALGSGVKEVLPAESELAAYARRGLQASRGIRAGEPLREGQNLEILRPGRRKLGLHPRYLAQLDGKKASRDIPAGEGIQEGDWLA